MLRKVLKTTKTYYGEREEHDENQYISLASDIIEHGDLFLGRNGNTKAIIGSSMEFNLKDGILPLMTTKKLAWKTCLKELLWFISGSTDNKILKGQNVKIWNGNSSREYLDSVGLSHYQEDELGPVYGHQWRHFNADYKGTQYDYQCEGIDQLQYIIDSLCDPEKKYSRRLIMSAWNPCQLHEMALPPCHILVQFNVTKNDELTCSLYQRSGDVGLGVPFNIASYSFLTHLIAKHCGLKATSFQYFLGNCHIYDDHIEQMKQQIVNEPYTFPTLNIINKRKNINEYCIEDFEIQNYVSHQVIKMNMRN